MDALAATIRQEVEGVEQTGVYVTLIVDMEGYETDFNATTGPPALFAIGYEPRDQMYDLELVDGAGWQNDPDREGVVLPRPMANSMNLAIGDTVRLAAGGSDYQAYPVIGIVEYPFDLIWLRWDSLARLASITNEAGDPMPNGLMVVLDEAQPTSAEVDRAITQTREALVQQGITATYTNVPNFIEVNSQQLDAAQGIFYLTAILISAVGAVGLLTTLSMSVFERQREIGVMRSVGAGSSTVAVQFITEGVATGLLAWLIGIPLSYWLSEQLIAALDFGDAFVLNYPPVTIALGLGGMVLLSLLASSWPALTASRQTVSHILRYQ
jgi:ABC-type lipoprotein release transport system permease subunit